MQNLRFVLLLAVTALLVAACQMTERTSPFLPNPFSGGGESPKTPPKERVASLLQEAKQQYDDGHFDAAHRYSESAVRVIKEHDLDDSDIPLALTIQAYCLLQLGRYDDYYVKGYGRLAGAVTKFKRALEENPKSLRAKLGLGLVRSRRHSDAINKAAKLSEGNLLLELIEDGVKRGFKDPTSRANAKLLEKTRTLLQTFLAGRQRLIGLGYIFRDPDSVPFDSEDLREEAPWLGTLTKGAEKAALDEIGWSIDDAIAYEEDETKLDTKDTLARVAKIRRSWTRVRFYWRHEALKDLQEARDRLLDVRKLAPDYFWVDRDLAVVFEGTGAFFLDIGLEVARNEAILEGIAPAGLNARAEQIYLQESFRHSSKVNSKENYAAAVTYLDNFALRHRVFERMRVEAVRKARANEPEDDPFTVDLVARYARTMNSLITEERSLRQLIILEAAALVIDPLFQINDLEKAIVYAERLRALDSEDPIHHFVLATAYYSDGKWLEARGTYDDFLRDSSIMQHKQQREIARIRRSECDLEIRRESSG